MRSMRSSRFIPHSDPSMRPHTSGPLPARAVSSGGSNGDDYLGRSGVLRPKGGGIDVNFDRRYVSLRGVRYAQRPN